MGISSKHPLVFSSKLSGVNCGKEFLKKISDC